MFQRLAEIYAQRMFPRRFAELVPKGRNPDGIAVAGWPDAYALRSDARMDVLEATLAQDWRRHLRKDIEKLRELDSNKIAGFLFVAWEPVPDFETEQEFHDKLVAAGVPPDTVTLVFAKRLVLDLCQPRFVALWTELLGLPSSCHPFERIQQAEGVFGGSAQAFAPTLSEYKAGLIHRPELLEEVKQRLRSRGWAWVQGRGATGKTVLGALTGLDHEAEEKPAYYLNVESLVEPGYVDSGDLFEILSTRADEGVLFVVDNVHLDANLASALFKHWSEVGQGSYWLMLGRFQELASPSRGVARPLEELRPEALVLENTPADLLGVYRRLVRRHSSTAVEPPDEVLGRWHGLFAADLIAFCAAVIGRLPQLALGQWDLTAADARNWVRDEYLSGSPGETKNLLRLAAMTSLELRTPEEALEVPALRPALQKGIVLRSEHGQARYRRYRLVHPGLGELLLAGAAAQPTPLLTDVAINSHFATSPIARRLEKGGHLKEVAAILEAAVSTPTGLASVVTRGGFGLVHAAGNLARLIRLGVRTRKEVNEGLQRAGAQLAAAALRTPLGDLASSLRYARDAGLVELHAAIVSSLAGAENREHLAAAALRTPLGDLASFLRYTREAGLGELHDAIVRSLESAENREHLAAAALRTPLSDLAFFLRYSRENEIEVTLLESISTDRWREAREGFHAQPDEAVGFSSFSREVGLLDRDDLSAAAAEWILSTCEARRLPSDFHIGHLSWLLYHGRSSDPRKARVFAKTVAEPTWLKEQYESENAQAGSLSRALFGIWGNNLSLLDLFHHPALLARLRRELSRVHGYTGEELVGVIRLLGVVDLLRVPMPDMRVRWPGTARVTSALRAAEPPKDIEGIKYVQSELWLGLRTMARLRKDPVRVPAAHGDRILDLWRAGEPETHRLQVFNEWMIDWLESCAKARWRLIADGTRFEEFAQRSQHPSS